MIFRAVASVALFVALMAPRGSLASGPVSVPASPLPVRGNYLDCLLSLEEGSFVTDTRRNRTPARVREELIYVPGHGAFATEARMILSKETPALAICRATLTAQLGADLPRYQLGLGMAAMFGVHTLFAGIVGAWWRPTFFPTTFISAGFFPALFFGVSGWRARGLLDALRAHSDGAPLDEALRTWVPRRLGEGYAVAGAVTLGGALVAFIPGFIAGQAPDDDWGSPFAFLWAPQMLIGIGYLVTGAVVANSTPWSTSRTSGLFIPLPYAWGGPGHGGVGVALSW